ncbi:MAG: PD-(D/E)XK nuclease family protein [Gammaproteobacteria bacterium]|nr:PD-(D/E)XK nuclease family protein [Gammaproteobacteria bacterium]MCI0591178.1 PD-(D/E)XK nuclease family protein [Gammaproteobacteria bacterium]
MSEQLRISAKNLGEVALPGFCPRCFWIKLRLQNKLPFQVFPGIFSSIDSYNKRLIHSWFDRHKGAPVWLKGLGTLSGYIEPPHFSKFNIMDKEYNILLTGSPDGIFVKPDRTHIIVDYKTSKYKGLHDKLYPMYEAQVNVYGMIGEQRGLAPVSGLALIYMEPVTDATAACDDANHRDNGFMMGFAANIQAVSLDAGIVRQLLKKAREIYEMPESPPGRTRCKDCELLANLLGVAKA